MDVKLVMNLFSIVSSTKLFFLIVLGLISGQSGKAAEKIEGRFAAVPQLLRNDMTQASLGIIQDNEWRELLLDEAIAALDSTLTGFGHLALKQSCMPIADRNEIIKRQSRLKRILQDEEIYAAFADDLQKIAKCQQPLLNYYQDHCQLHTEAKKLYFSIFPETLNNNQYALDASFMVDCGKVAAMIAGFLGAQATIKKLSLDQDESQAQEYRKIKGSFINAEHWGSDPLSMQELVTGFTKEAQPYSFKTALIDGFWYPFIQNKKSIDRLLDHQKHSSVGLGLEAAGFIGFNAQIGIGLYGMYKQLRESWSKPNELATQLRTVSQFFYAAADIAKCAEKHPELSEWDAIIKLKNLANAAGTSDQLKQLMNLLQGIEHDTSFIWYSRGRILLAHKLLTDVAHELIPYIHAIGEIDACMSCVRLIKHASPEKPWSFAVFDDSSTPIIESNDFWLPLIPSGNVVLNSISCGRNNPIKIVLTGPNGGGKSTIMKSLAYQVVFAQSWGIVPARSTHLTIFNKLRTGFNPQEDTKRGLSSFMAQRERMEQLLDIASDASDNIFVLVDEPYRGTVETTAQKLVFEFGKKMASSAKTMLVLATHFELPTTLSSIAGNAYSNYQCEFVRTAQGRLERSYKLLPGVATWWFHDDAMRSLYLDCLDDAGVFISRMKSTGDDQIN